MSDTTERIILDEVVPHTGDVDRNDLLPLLGDLLPLVVPHTGDVDRNLCAGRVHSIGTPVVPHTGDVDRNGLGKVSLNLGDGRRPPYGGRG